MTETVKSKEPTRGQRTRRKEESRPKRKTLEDQLSRIEVMEGLDPEFKYRWVFDDDEDGQRIFKLRERGYEFALAKDHKVASAHTFDTAGKFGSIIRKADGKSGGYLYLMRIPMEFYEEDLATKQKIADNAVKDIYKKHKDEDEAEDDDEVEVYNKKMDIQLKR